TYEFAARTRYSALWIIPHNENNLTATLKRLCQDRLQIKGLLHTLHIHSDIGSRANQAQRRAQIHVPRTLRGLIHKTLSKSDLNIQKLTIHFDTIVLPYVILAWTNTAHSLVHLELQFSANSPSNPLLSLKSEPHFPNLKTFVLSNGSWNYPPSFRSMTIMNLGEPRWHGVKEIFDKIKSLLPEGLESLSLHHLCSVNDWAYSCWTIPPLFLAPNDFPNLQIFAISNLSLDKNPSLVRFIQARIASLQSLGLERVGGSGPRILEYLSGTVKLRALSLSLNSVNDVLDTNMLQAGQLVSPIHWFQHLRRLDITPYWEYYRDEDVIFVLLVELGRASSVLEELNVCTPELGFRHLRAVLLFLSKLSKLTFSGVEDCKPDIRNFSSRPEIWRTVDPRTYAFFNLGQAKQCLGGDIRREMAAELRSDVQSAYRHVITTAQNWDKLHSSIKKALKGGYVMGDEATNTMGVGLSDVQVDYRIVVITLVESL
ncbi:hypothetical protein DL96DRAFT_1626275, partial [Flagelloscypha sp. PMI_526]